MCLISSPVYTNCTNMESVGDITIGYDPPRRGLVIPLVVHDERAQKDVEDGGS